MPLGDSASPPEVTRCSSRPCRPQTPWWGERLRLRSAGSTLPHLWPTGSSSGWPPSITARYFSAGPSDSISPWTPCPPENCSCGRRRVTAVFGYSAPHLSARGTSTLQNNALLSAHYWPPPPPSRRPPTSRLHRLYGFPAPRLSPRDEEGFSSCLRRPCHRAVANAPPEHLAASVSCDDLFCLHPQSWVRPLDLGFSRSPVRSFSLRPDDLLTIPWMALSINSMCFVSSTHAILATGV